MPYEVEFSASREFRKLPAAVRGGTQKLVGERNGRRLRVGDYRILYEIRDSDRRILIVTIGHRREIYRRR
ncbi:MAG TPA: type II toxin-antitoxin system RelE/ParE family toxin [Candidatus Binataceae bacterium]|nr:type II toxin-antitoxin system RelE/ParE family toxin [Candidatus Binataceae bacterium]